MANRREFILTAAAAGASLMGAVGAQASEPTAELYTAVYDERYQDSVAFARQARRQGLRVSSIKGDITNLWYDDLYHRWKKGPAAIAGLTTSEALFCLEILGNDVGLQRVLKIEHRASAGGVEHRLEGPAGLLQQAALQACGTAWSARVAQLASRCPLTRAGRIETVALSRGSAMQADQPNLVSWVLAPVKRA